MKHLYADGTFKIAPPLFAQVYVVMAQREGFVLPVLYALLPDKRETTYRRMFEAIKARWPRLPPESIAMDFELAAVNAFKATFPAAEIYGCFFHLIRNLKKKLAQLGLLKKYRRDAEFAVATRMIIALAFVPVDMIEDVFGELAGQPPADLNPVLDWFEDTYIGRPTRRGDRRAPMFPPQMWSVYQRTLMGRDRTNNFVEATHRRMRAEFGVDHPTLWKFINCTRAVQAGRDHYADLYFRGEEPPKRRRKDIRSDERIR